MAIEFRQVSCPPLSDVEATATGGYLIAVVGENGSGKGALLQLAAGLLAPTAGEVQVAGSRRFLGAGDPLNLSPVDNLLLENVFSRQDALVRGRATVQLERLRRAGSTILLVSHEEELVRALADEAWWLDGGRLVERGDPGVVLDAYRRHVAGKLRAWGETVSAPLSPRLRRGDGRAHIVAVELRGESGQASPVWRSGEQVTVQVTVRFEQPVADPVVGILIRTRVGLNVYGTNTELEGLRLGPRQAGESLTLDFAFRCDLCPQEYTLTVASHDPDGVWHDWLEEAVAFSVTDSRSTSGVANLRARVSLRQD